jgi:3-isopropylmalate/(R)-2-methylmalate dehydratase small subunit
MFSVVPNSRHCLLWSRIAIGYGSSRANAVWALYDYGFRVIIAPTFGDIFFNSSFKNGLLPVVLPDDAASQLRASLECAHGARIMVDLAAQVVTGPDQSRYEFSVDPFRKQLLFAGMDDSIHSIVCRSHR